MLVTQREKERERERERGRISKRCRDSFTLSSDVFPHLRLHCLLQPRNESSARPLSFPLLSLGTFLANYRFGRCISELSSWSTAADYSVAQFDCHKQSGERFKPNQTRHFNRKYQSTPPPAPRINNSKRPRWTATTARLLLFINRTAIINHQLPSEWSSCLWLSRQIELKSTIQTVDWGRHRLVKLHPSVFIGLSQLDCIIS